MDAWDGGTNYVHYMGRWSRYVARTFLEWLDLPRSLRWVDVGCGTGALTGAIAATASPAALAGIDLAADFIDAARTELEGRADFSVGDAQALPFDSGEFDVVVSGIALKFVPDPGLGVREMIRVPFPGGVVAVYL